MRKSSKVIAGLGVVAGLGVALAPLGVFAVSTPTRTDVLRFTNQEACTVNSAQLDGTTVDLYNYYDGTVTPGGTGSLTVVDGTQEETHPGGATEQVFTINCNIATGYKVIANANNPVGTDADNDDQTVYPGTTVSGNQSYWAAKVASVSGNLTSTNGVNFFAINSSNQKIASNSGGSAATGDSFTMIYEVGASNALKAGNYEGSVAYTVVEGAN